MLVKPVVSLLPLVGATCGRPHVGETCGRPLLRETNIARTLVQPPTLPITTTRYQQPQYELWLSYSTYNKF
jgi:hypothetical protein